jgi:hypothetical protein
MVRWLLSGPRKGFVKIELKNERKRPGDTVRIYLSAGEGRKKEDNKKNA